MSVSSLKLQTHGLSDAAQIWQEFQIHEFQYDWSFMYFPEVKVHFLSVRKQRHV